jgi:hypothetical protein
VVEKPNVKWSDVAGLEVSGILWDLRILMQCCGSESGIRCFFDPWIRITDGKKIRIWIPDLFSEF